ncbi:dNA polymerase III polC-type [Blautia hydrogenotrophica CAG:147]|nr:PolC-type DNA polymerase III N-terminal domain-containing protein [Blautia hydrogenotrophica]CCX59684.1 dNA polymerase III polC-type [Blautia hydrogenotrophica CAG:147]
MEKDFFEVFPRLKVGEELKEWLEMVRVTKVACNPDKTCLRVYIRSERWIHKKHILALEKEILRQCFPGISIEVKVIEKFRLSEQYTPENFWGIYHSSMALELKNYNMLEYNLFQQAKIEFKGSHDLVLTLPDSLISHEKGEILVEYLEKVFCERCGMDLKVESVYVKVEESKYRKNSALQIQQEVSQMVRKVQENQGVQQAKQEEEEKKGRKDSFSDFGKNRRRERPADLVYGRDFDEESIPLGNVTKAFRWRM